MIMRTRADGWTRTEQSVKLCMSMSKIDKIISRLKRKYDEVQRFDPVLPPRKESAEELYMDEH